ncbi:M1 family aminopeptidase [Pedobacter caeni]|uniref:Peptidase family M1 n=1 Tax=Pedobacter caeni TaxID=288992 RepID=A0A1M5GCL6_9SPHI|nr:M1 family aminopeptidase [Pedobacter caeni]SHG01495.1 Peptidase family M1 [Pedobacter caeni]
MRSKIKYMYLCCLLGFSSIGYAQKNLQYRMEVKTDLTKGSFSVKGILSFQTEAYSADSVQIVLTKGDTEPVIRLLNTDVKISKTDTSRNSSGDIVYQLSFSRSLAPGSQLNFDYQYERGSRRSFQYFIDSTFCMAGGYGTAWYPQVNSLADDGSKKYTRGTGTISVTTAPALTAVMAASTAKVLTGSPAKTLEFSYTQPDIFSLYIGNYNTHHYNGIVPFYAYTLASTPYNEEVPIKSEQVLSFLSTQFGPLKIPSFSIIEFPEHVSEQTGIGGASLLGGILMPSSAIRRFNYALFGHELAHQWWGNLVMAKGNKGEAILSEGMAQYGSLQVVQKFDPEHAIDYRKTGYPGYIKDQSGFGYLKNAAAGNDEPLTRLTGSNDHIIADSKGFLVLELLSETVGKQNFNKALHQMTSKYQTSGLRWEDFTKEISLASGTKLDWFFKQWFEQTGIPEWKSSWQQQQNEVLLSITQQNNSYRFPLQLLITYENGESSLKKVEISQQISKLKIPVKGKVKSIKTDPYFQVIHWGEEMKPEAVAMAKVSAVQKLRIEQKFEAAEKLALSYIDTLSKSDKYGVEFSLLYILGRMKGTQKKNAEALEYYMRAVRCASRTTDYLAYSYYRIAQLAAEKKDRELFNWAVQNALKADELNNDNDHIRTMTDRLSF